MLTASEAKAITMEVNKKQKEVNGKNFNVEVGFIVDYILEQVQELAEKGYSYYWYTFSDEHPFASQAMAMQALRDLGYSASFRGFKGYLIRW